MFMSTLRYSVQKGKTYIWVLTSLVHPVSRVHPVERGDAGSDEANSDREFNTAVFCLAVEHVEAVCVLVSVKLG